MNETPPTKEPSFYEQICSIDIIDPVMEFYRAGGFKADLKTKKFIVNREIALHRTWTICSLDTDRECGKWASIYHKYYKILPPPCKQCWKVVYHPKTLAELIEVQKLQAELKLPGKCGLEKRDYTSGLGQYRAFWYCPFYGGLKGGRAHFKRIRNALIKHFDESMILEREDNNHLYLKRGCTEFERDFGPSDQWDEIDHSAKFTLLETVWAPVEDTSEEFIPLIYTNYKRWIEFAMAYGDPSVHQYIRSDKPGVQSVKYQNSSHSDEQYECLSIPLNGTDEKDGANESEESAGEEENLFELKCSRG